MTIQYETREAGLNAFVTEARPIFETLGYAIPEKVRVSVGYAPNTRASKRNDKIAACVVWPSASGDGTHEIFISPANVTDVEIFAALTHELAHCAAGKAAGHKGAFATLARALGLAGALTATYAGAEWFNWASPIVQDIAMPYAAITLNAGDINTPKKETYALKIECPTCGWHGRASAKNSVDIGMLNCPVPSCDDMLIIHPRKGADD